jgi:hypothetical protein
MKKQFLYMSFFCSLWVLPTGVSAQGLKENAWRLLAKLTYIKKEDPVLGFKVDVPVYGKEVKAMEGKEITIRGYIIPTDGYKSTSAFILSAFPYNMCFFCGGAGPETVIDVVCKTPIPYTTDPVTLKGALHLNGGDVNTLLYTLQNAVKAN